MIDLTEAQLKKWKETFAKDGIAYESDDDYREAVSNLVGYFDILIRMDQEQKSKINTEEKQTLLEKKMSVETQAIKPAFIAKPLEGETKAEFKARLKKIVNSI